jgi:hypothetical protein
MEQFALEFDPPLASSGDKSLRVGNDLGDEVGAPDGILVDAVVGVDDRDVGLQVVVARLQFETRTLHSEQRRVVVLESVEQETLKVGGHDAVSQRRPLQLRWDAPHELPSLTDGTGGQKSTEFRAG